MTSDKKEHINKALEERSFNVSENYVEKIKSDVESVENVKVIKPEKIDNTEQNYEQNNEQSEEQVNISETIDDMVDSSSSEKLDKILSEEKNFKNDLIQKLKGDGKEPLIVVILACIFSTNMITNLIAKYIPSILDNGSITNLGILIRSTIMGIIFYIIKQLV